MNGSFRDIILQRMIVKDDNSVKPLFFRTGTTEEKNVLSDFLQSNPECIVLDKIESQLRDFVKLENPERSLTEEEYQQKIQEKLSGKTTDEYGVWVYYPWKNTLLHQLDEEEFIRVRTIRNAYKITLEEQAQLRTKKVGIIGLSVGQSVAMTIAMERGAGELRIADFDTLELSNLNRIRTGIHNIGLKKTIVVAREIAEIDPFLKVVRYDDGINEGNVSGFFDEGGRIDLLIEECDSVDIKILAREEAKKRRIPVLMDTSDRGMLDIERFDKEPDYQLLHGLVDTEVTYEFLSNLKTSEEKLPYIVPILGAENLSTRLKASGLEVGKSITTWPQLGSDVVLGGALCANAARRILLGEDLPSGRSYVDLDALIARKEVETFDNFKSEDVLSDERIGEILGSFQDRGDKVLSDEEKKVVIDNAIMAPSPGNMQQWKFCYKNEYLFVFIDKKEGISFSDNLQIASVIAIGCALENIRQYCESIGIQVLIDTQISIEHFPLVAKVSFIRNEKVRENENFSAYLKSRRTVRSNNCTPVDTEDFQRFIKSNCNDEHINLGIITDSEIISKLSQLVCFGDRIRLTNPQAHYEFFNEEIRWTREEAESKRNGLDIGLFDLTASDRTGLKLSKDPDVIKFINQIEGGRGFEKISEKTFLKSSGIGVVLGKSYSHQDLIEAGMRFELSWLWATKNNIGLYPVTVLPMLMSFLHSDKFGYMPQNVIQELTEIENELRKLIPDLIDRKLLFMYRISSLEQTPYMSVRQQSWEKLVTL